MLHHWRLIRFWFGKRIFAASSWLRSRHESVSIFLNILQTIFAQVVLAIVLVVGLEALESFLWGHVGAIRQLLPASDLVNHLAYMLKQAIERLYSGGPSDILNTLAQVAGIFLGLYFTAVGVVASTVYAHVPRNVRSFLMREKVSNFYIRSVAFLGAISTLLLFMDILGFKPGILNILFVTFLGIFSIFSFLVLGRRVFNFFDPTALVNYLAIDVIRWIRSATPLGFEWQNPSFQTYSQRRAEELLATYRDIVFLVIHEGMYLAHGRDSLVFGALSAKQA